MGFSFNELEDIDLGLFYDMMTERSNDSAEYNRIATQEDMDRF